MQILLHVEWPATQDLQLQGSLSWETAWKSYKNSKLYFFYQEKIKK